VASQATPATSAIRDSIVRVVEDRGAGLVAHYYSDPQFAGALFDDFGENPTDRFTADDLMAVSLLDVRFGPEAVRALLVVHVADDLLADVATSLPLWEADYDTVLGKGSSAGRLWARLRDIRGIGRTRASKLLARKRPALLPILDSVVGDALGLGAVGSCLALHDALADGQIRTAIDGMSPGLDGPAPSTLRLLDVATWMRFSESKNARSVRQTLGLPVAHR